MVKKPAYTPERGDVVWIDLNPTKGHEQAHKRPVFVLSPKSYNEKTKMVLVCPITSQKKGYPFEVEIQEKKVSGVILSDQIRSLDWSIRKVTFIQKAKRNIYDEVIEKIHVLITD